jgi:hypothetical protein
MECSQFEALLAEAVEDQLSVSQMTEFRAHAAGCQACGVMFADALAGHRLLQSLHEIEPPETLFAGVIARTSANDPAMKRVPTPGMMERLRLWMRPLVTPMLQPRIAGSFAMAFFSIALLLNISGIHITDLRHMDLRPSAVRLTMERGFYQTRARAVRYYESVRWVYELQAQLRQLRNAATPEEQQKPERREKKGKDHSDMSSQPDQQQYQNYASDAADELAAWNRDQQMNLNSAVYDLPPNREHERRQA